MGTDVPVFLHTLYREYEENMGLDGALFSDRRRETDLFVFCCARLDDRNT